MTDPGLRKGAGNMRTRARPGLAAMRSVAPDGWPDTLHTSNRLPVCYKPNVLGVGRLLS